MLTPLNYTSCYCGTSPLGTWFFMWPLVFFRVFCCLFVLSPPTTLLPLLPQLCTYSCNIIFLSTQLASQDIHINKTFFHNLHHTVRDVLLQVSTNYKQ